MDRRRFVILVADSAGCGALPDAARVRGRGLGHHRQHEPRGRRPLRPGARTDGARPPDRDRRRAPRAVPDRVPRPHGRAVPGQGHHHRALGDDGDRPEGGARALPARLPARDRRAVREGDRRPRHPRQPRRERDGDHRGARARSTSAPASRSSTPRPTRSSRSRRTRRRSRSRSCTAGAAIARQPARSAPGGARHRAAVRRDAREVRPHLPPQGLLDRDAGEDRARAARRAPASRSSASARSPTSSTARGITDEVHTEGNADGLAKTEALLDRVDHGLVFVNLVDFDMLYGHRNDPQGYARALEEMDRALPRLLGKLAPGRGLRHHRRPRLRSDDAVHRPLARVRAAPRPRRPGRGGGKLGTRPSFADLGATVSEFFGLRPDVGTSFLAALR